MLDYRQLEALNEVIKQKQFVAAADKLAITQSALSQKIKSLEETLGTPVLIRSSPLRPTVLGEKLIALYRKVLLLEKSTLGEVLEGKTVGYTTVPVAVNTESLSTWFLDAIVPSMQALNILIELVIDDQDRTTEFLKAGRVLGCVTSQKTAPNGCKSYELGNMPYLLVCTPGFKKQFFGEGISKKSLETAPAAIYGKYDRIHDDFIKKYFPSFNVTKPPYHYIPSPQGLIDLTLKGVCYSLLPKMSVQKLIDQNKMVNLMPGKSYPLDLYWHVWSHDEPHLDHLTKQILKVKKFE
jgi:LysR family transcriptional regulator (chromosome initiation inhibitor)